MGKKIIKITFEDGTENAYKELPLEKFKKEISFRPEYHFRRQHKEWEEDVLLSNLMTDLEDYAKEQYNLVDEDKLLKIHDFSDGVLLNECAKRHLLEDEINNKNIINESFIERLIVIANRGNDSEIDFALEALEKKYRIK